MARIDPQINIRLPAELLQRVAADATANKRSTTAEIVARLEASGETLRDEFAMAALASLPLRSWDASVPEGKTMFEAWAAAAYATADAMLAERYK